MTNIDIFDKTLTTCEAMNLSFKLLEDLDYTQNETIVSFYRCDFRRSKINNCVFYKNPFGRSDFIDTYICNSRFQEVNWGSCLFENATFENVQFIRNRYKGVSARYTYFKNCSFTKETIVINMFDCIYQACVFVDCIFEKSSISNVTFVNCTFIRTDLSQCHAEKLKFDLCKLEEVFLGLPFWATYLFKDTFINRFAFKYHGQTVDIIRKDYFMSAFSEFWEKERLFEFINAHIISKQLSMKSDLLDIVQKVFQKLTSMSIKIRRKIVLDILDMLEFYFSYNNIDFLSYYSIVEFISDYTWEGYEFSETVEYSSKIFKIKILMSNFMYDYKYLYTINANQKCECIFRINCETQEDAIDYLTSVYNIANINLCNSYYNSPLFEIKSIAAGSIILTITSWALLSILVSYSAKRVAHNLESIKLERNLNAAIQKQISDKGSNLSITDIEKIGKVAAKYHLINTEDEDEVKLNKVTSEITKGEILSIILNLIF